MTFFNPFRNLNMGNFMFGMNNWFTPMFSCSFMPSFMNFSAFLPSNWEFPIISDWGCSLFDNFIPTSFSAPPPTPTFTMPSVFENNISSNSNLSTNNIWDTPITPSWDNYSPAKVNWSNGNWGSVTSVGDSFTLNNKNKAKFSMKEYNANAGERLAKLALTNCSKKFNKKTRKFISETKNPYDFTSNCARYVKANIRDAGLGAYPDGHAYQMASALRKNKNFKEISPTEYNVNSLPAGCILVYSKGVARYNKDYGHVEITTGDGRAVSDGITRDLRQPSAIFVPVNPTA